MRDVIYVSARGLSGLRTPSAKQTVDLVGLTAATIVSLVAMIAYFARP